MMKPLTRSAPTTRRFHSNPAKPVALALFWTLAFLPAIMHLIWHAALIISPLLGVGPVAAGFWLACTICETRLSLALLGPLLSVLLWLVNCLMLAGGGCCSMG